MIYDLTVEVGGEVCGATAIVANGSAPISAAVEWAQMAVPGRAKRKALVRLTHRLDATISTSEFEIDCDPATITARKTLRRYEIGGVCCEMTARQAAMWNIGSLTRGVMQCKGYYAGQEYTLRRLTCARLNPESSAQMLGAPANEIE